MDQCTHCIVRGDIDKCRATECSQHESWYTKSLEARLAEALAMLKEANHAVAEDDAEIKSLEAQLDEVKEPARLASESYDSNARGWQEDLKKLRERELFLEGVRTYLDCKISELRSENERLSYELSKVVGLAPAALIEAGKISVKCDQCEKMNLWNPCGHTGAESFVCEKCGYPWAALRERCERLEKALNGAKHFVPFLSGYYKAIEEALEVPRE